MGLRDWFKTGNPPENESMIQESDSEAKVTEVVEYADKLVENLLEVQEHLQTQSDSLHLRQTRLEQIGWELLNQTSSNYGGVQEIDHQERANRNKQAEFVWREDPVVGRAVETINEYTWGRGLPTPRAQDLRVQRLIDSFWADEDNKLVFTTFEAQMAKGTDLQLFGELFIPVFDQGEWTDLDIDEGPEDVDEIPDTNDQFLPPSETEGKSGRVQLSGAPSLRVEKPKEKPLPPSAVKLGQIHPNEIVDIIPDEDFEARPRYYKRVTVEKKYDYAKGEWSTATSYSNDRKVRYYEDFVHEPREGQGSPAGVAEGKILHIAVNRNSFNLRGNSEVWRSVKWARALTDFFTWRMSMLRALATFVFKKKVRGGPTAVQQAAQRSAAGPGRTGLPGDFDPYAPPSIASLITENQNENLEQFKTSSNAGEAEQDAQMLRGQIGASLGLPIHYLGDKGSANLANASAMETPVLKMMEARQELFEQAITKVLKFCIDKAIKENALPDDIDRTFYVEMPPIMMRNVPELIAALTNTQARLDPFSTDIKLKRFVLQQVLNWMGYPDPDKVASEVYPPGMEDQPQVQVPGINGGPPIVPTDNTIDPNAQAAQGALAGARAPLPAPPGGLQLGVSGPNAGTPEPLRGRQPFPGANTGVTNGSGVAASASFPFDGSEN